MRALFYVEHNYAFSILRPLQQEIRARGGKVAWFCAGDEISPSLIAQDERQLASVDQVISYAPEAVFVPGDRVPGFFPGLKVQVFHGINEDKRGGAYPERGLFDLYCTEGPGRTAMLAPLAAQKGYFKVEETGWIKLDALLQSASSRDSRNLSEPQILYASTFTPRLSSADALYEEIGRLVKEKSWRWMITLHPKMSPKTIEKYRQLEHFGARYIDSAGVLNAMCDADIMVCDNSSILQEFLLLNKPVVTYRNRDPQPCMVNISDAHQLEAAIEKALAPGPEMRSAIEHYGASITPFLDGKSSARVYAAAQELLASGWQDKKPKNIWRNLKMRRQLAYYKDLIGN
ncbi:MAG: CDP-glycerol glycerophosphotransferase family protein [Gammaproteobacteria bacterium]|nr:CDP-glycerol glycerophosphotransferase family protein [Gammaproteobacteria bacterium]NND39679.1 CDP-glycerol--glycerophosphate glycerophosphotransferase [Pseudomonadales bacterium]NNM12320.1 CDP-glycerol--glycerophosphate glycerophosphotransferase [Pseudomonadales bacterium]RZV55306.1 MAG: CDP-glycerol--glycerophosphate glycerophosphotransferase [Pseudomonadales bacterium]